MANIYSITCKSTGRSYIGSSITVYKRWKRHIIDLNNGQHHSQFLQRAWDKYGQDDFEFAIIDECNSDDMLEREQFWIDTVRPSFNMYPVAGSPLGIKRTDEARKNMSNAHLGKTHSSEHKINLANSLKKTYTVISPFGEIFVVHGLKHFCSENGLSSTKMSAVANGKRKSHKGWKCKHGEYV